jgi:3-oxoadipate enol-lactonase
MKFANPRTVSMGFIAQPENMRSNQWNLDRIRNQPQRLYVYLSALGKNYRTKTGFEVFEAFWGSKSMPMIRANGTALYYEDTGGSGAPIVFSHGLLWNSTLFAPQIAVLKNRYRCIAYDHRGQGRSADDIGRAISMETVTEDAVALIEKLDLGPVHFCGLSLGGIVGMRLAVGRPDLIRSLVLLDTTADAEPHKLKYKLMTVMARLFGVGFVAPAVMPALYGKTTLNDPARADERQQWTQQLIMNRRSIWRAANGVLERKSIYGELGKIAAPTLVMVGDEDVSTPKALADRIVGAIPRAKLMVVPGAGHGSTLEQPAVVTAAIGAFLDAESGHVAAPHSAAAA